MSGVQCPVSGGSSINCNWSSISGSVRDVPGVGVKQCQTCQLVTHTSDLRNRVNYESGSMHEWSVGYGELNLEKPETDIGRRMEALKILSESHKIETVLDFGCGTGEMLRAMSEFYTVSGVEPDQQAREKAQAFGNVIWDSAVDAISSGEKYDLVTLFHVVEHLYQPFVELERVKSLLHPGGILVIETPNANDALLTIYASKAFQQFTYWSHHPMLHSDSSLKSLLVNTGFSILEDGGVQRYNLANHLYWLSTGKPGGHDIWLDLVSQETNTQYQMDLIERKTCDTLWFVART